MNSLSSSLSFLNAEITGIYHYVKFWILTNNLLPSFSWGSDTGPCIYPRFSGRTELITQLVIQIDLCDLSGLTIAVFTLRSPRTRKPFSPWDWVPQESQCSTEGLEDCWRVAFVHVGRLKKLSSDVGEWGWWQQQGRWMCEQGGWSQQDNIRVDELPQRCFYWFTYLLGLHVSCGAQWSEGNFVELVLPFHFFLKQSRDWTQYQLWATGTVYLLSNLTDPNVFIKRMATPTCVQKSVVILSRDLPCSLTSEGSCFIGFVESGGRGGPGAAAQVDFKQCPFQFLFPL